MKVRTAQPSDAKTIADFNARMALETEDLALDAEVVFAGVEAALRDSSKAIYFVAEDDDRVVGQMMITHEWSDWRNGDLWWIQSVYVHEEYRRRGVFRALYQYARDQAKRAGAVGLRLYVEEHNAPAQQTYQQVGMNLTHYRVMEELW
jgi:GNAT superfamily N-acetyltransferase